MVAQGGRQYYRPPPATCYFPLQMKRGRSGAAPTQACAWVFTVFAEDVTSDLAAFQAALEAEKDIVRYAAFQRELCPDSGRAHCQGYILLHRKKTMGGVKKLLGDNGAHLEVRRGTHAEARDYCMKDASRDPAEGSGPYSFGEEPAPGKRNDIDALKKDLDSGMSLRGVSDAHFSSFLRYNKGIELYLSLRSEVRTWQTQLIVYWGPSGTGKTTAAKMYDTPSNTFYLSKPKGNLWWDGYRGERTIVVEEFYGWIQRDLFQRLVDSTPLRQEVKGGSVSFLGKRIIVTSNSPVERWWKCGLGAMERRLCEPIGCTVFMGTVFQGPDKGRRWDEASYRASLEPAAQVPYVASSSQLSVGGFY